MPADDGRGRRRALRVHHRNARDDRFTPDASAFGFYRRCGTRRLRSERVPGDWLVEIFRNPVLDWYHAVEDFQSFAVSWVGCNRSTYYAFGGNDVLGSINKFYEPPGYGAGQHVDVVSYGDFTLVYTITVAPLPGAVILNPNP
jgi:hypothetical protein